MADNSKDYIRKNVDVIILRTLLESDSYGYDILKEIEAKSNGAYVVKQPTLYNSLKRLEKIGYISSYDGEETNGGKRRYYKLTDQGRSILDKETAEWEYSRTLMSRLLSDKEYDLNAPPPFDPNELRPLTKRNVAPVTDNPASTNYRYTAPPITGNKPQETVLYSESSEKREYSETNSVVNNSEKVTQTEKIKEELISKSDGKSYNYNNLAVSPASQTSNADKKDTAAYKILFGPIQSEKQEDKQEEKLVEPVEVKEKIKDEPKYEASSSPFQLTLNEALPKKENIAQNINTIDKPVFEQTIKEKPAYNTEIITEKPSYGEIPRDDIKLSQNFRSKPRREVDPVQMKPLSEEQILTNNVQYRPALDELFGSTLPRASRESVTSVYDTPAPAVNVSGGASYNSLKAKLKTEGYMLRPYSRTSAVNHYLTGFIYNNQINRDCVTVMYLLLAIQIMGIYFLADSILNLGIKAYLTLASALILVPISFWIIYAVNPNKRIKARFNFKVSILTSLMIFFNLLVVIMLAGFFIFHADISAFDTMILPVFVPAILILNIPLASIIYSVLYNTRQYHLKN